MLGDSGLPRQPRPPRHPGAPAHARQRGDQHVQPGGEPAEDPATRCDTRPTPSSKSSSSTARAPTTPRPSSPSSATTSGSTTVPRVHLSKSRNIGIAHAAGDVIAFIDDDAIPEPYWLAELAAAYDAPDVGGAGGVVYDHTGASFQYEYSACSRVAVPRFDVKPPFDIYTRPGPTRSSTCKGPTAASAGACSSRSAGSTRRSSTTWTRPKSACGRSTTATSCGRSRGRRSTTSTCPATFGTTSGSSSIRTARSRTTAVSPFGTGRRPRPGQRGVRGGRRLRPGGESGRAGEPGRRGDDRRPARPLPAADGAGGRGRHPPGAEQAAADPPPPPGRPVPLPPVPDARSARRTAEGLLRLAGVSRRTAAASAGSRRTWPAGTASSATRSTSSPGRTPGTRSISRTASGSTGCRTSDRRVRRSDRCPLCHNYLHAANVYHEVEPHPRRLRRARPRFRSDLAVRGRCLFARRPLADGPVAAHHDEDDRRDGRDDRRPAHVREHDRPGSGRRPSGRRSSTRTAGPAWPRPGTRPAD